mgnify:CR=1 FL=1
MNEERRAGTFDFLSCFSSIPKLFKLIYKCYHYQSFLCKSLWFSFLLLLIHLQTSQSYLYMLSLWIIFRISGQDTWRSYEYHIKYNRRSGQLNCNYQVHGNSRFSICMYVSWLMNTCLSLDPGWTLSVYFYYIHISTST